MKLSQTELKILVEIAKGNEEIPMIAKALNKSNAQIYKSAGKLIKQDMIYLFKGCLMPKRTAHLSLLLQLLSKYPSLVEPFSGSGIEILRKLIEPQKIEEIMPETGVKRTQIFKKIKQAKAISLVRSEKDRYYLNSKLWSLAIDFFKELNTYESTTDLRVPADSKIYFKTSKEILFSNNKEQKATLTAFSAYEEYGIKVLLSTKYYYLPKKELSKEDIFEHSLKIAENTMDIRQLILVALFYSKYKQELSKIKHVVLSNLDGIFQGRWIPFYPTLQEIKERALIYDVKL